MKLITSSFQKFPSVLMEGASVVLYAGCEFTDGDCEFTDDDDDDDDEFADPLPVWRYDSRVATRVVPGWTLPRIGPCHEQRGAHSSDHRA